MNNRAAERRINIRFNKVFPVLVSSEIHGESRCVARNISAGGMMVEMSDPLPLGAMVTVHFRMPDSQAGVEVLAEVKHHYCFNYHFADEPASSRGIGLRFVEFVRESDGGIEQKRTRQRILH